MIHITDAKEVQNFISYLNKVNQIFKNCIKDKDNPQIGQYSLHKNKVYSFNSEPIAKIKATLVYAKKEAVVEEYMKDLSLYIDGKEFFNFLSNNKKYINEIEEQEDGLHIKTSLPEVEFLIKKLDMKESNDIILYKKFKNEIYDKYIKDQEYISEYTLSEDEVKNLIESDVPITLKFDDYRIKITKNTIYSIIM